MWDAFKENLSNAKYEAYQLLLDSFQPTKSAQKIQNSAQVELFTELSEFEKAKAVFEEIEKLEIPPSR